MAQKREKRDAKLWTFSNIVSNSLIMVKKFCVYKYQRMIKINQLQVWNQGWPFNIAPSFIFKFSVQELRHDYLNGLKLNLFRRTKIDVLSDNASHPHFWVQQLYQRRSWWKLWDKRFLSRLTFPFLIAVEWRFVLFISGAVITSLYNNWLGCNMSSMSKLYVKI